MKNVASRVISLIQTFFKVQLCSSILVQINEVLLYVGFHDMFFLDHIVCLDFVTIYWSLEF